MLCIKCGDDKPDDSFHRTKINKSGRRQPCASCRSTAKPKRLRTCKSCGSTNPETGWAGTSAYCKPCWRSRRKPHDPVKRRNTTLLRRYGIGVADYDRMRAEQGGKCAICQRGGIELVPDHNHETKFVRGLLCHPCNAIIGIWKENPECADRLKVYLAKEKIRLVA